MTRLKFKYHSWIANIYKKGIDIGLFPRTDETLNKYEYHVKQMITNLQIRGLLGKNI